MSMLVALLVLLTITAMAIALTQLRPEAAARLALHTAHGLLGLQRLSVSIEGLRITYLEAGRGEPLILLHGMGADKDNFLKIAAPLAKHYRVIIPDLPGFGESDKPADRSYAIVDQVRMLNAFVAALGIRRFDLGGNSMGGFIAGAYAATHRTQVASLWLLAPAGVTTAEPSELMRRYAEDGSLPILGRTPDDMRRIIRFVTHKPPFLPDFMIRAMALEQDRQYEFNRRVIEEMLQGPGLEQFLSATEIRIPALIVWGEQDRALDISGAEILHRLLPRSQVRRMADIGHVPQIEAPTVVVSDYLAFRQSEG